MGLVEDMVAELEQEAQATRRVLERVPDDKAADPVVELRSKDP